MICSMTAALGRKRATLGTKDKGFTLIELLVVVLILGVLSAVAIPIFLNQQDGAKDSAVQTQITQAKTALAIQIAEGKTVTEAVGLMMTTSVGNSTEQSFSGYSPSDKITVTAVRVAETDTVAEGFEITGFWDETDSATAATSHGFTITDTSAVTPYVAG